MLFMSFFLLASIMKAGGHSVHAQVYTVKYVGKIKGEASFQSVYWSTSKSTHTCSTYYTTWKRKSDLAREMTCLFFCDSCLIDKCGKS